MVHFPSLSLTLSFLLNNTPARAADVTASCNGQGAVAPTSHKNQTCDSVCDKVAGNWTCDLRNFSQTCNNGGALTIVTDYSGQGIVDFSAWGSCDSNKFCCTFDDDTVPGIIGAVVAQGTTSADNIHFDYGHDNDPLDLITNEDLEPHVTSVSLKGFIYGGSGDDTVEGSHFTDSSAFYRDNLYGEDGADIIDGNQDGDWLSGGLGADTMKGDDGDDSMDGGQGDESMAGAAGADVLCDDANAGGSCAASGDNYFNGGDGNDTIWYAVNGCGSFPMDAASTAGAGTDVCGNQSSPWAIIGDLPSTCDSFITTVPAACTDPN